MKEDVTLEVQELINMLQKAKLVELGNAGNHVSIEELIKIIERYYTPGSRLEDKLTEEKFSAYLKANPLKLAVNKEIEQWKERMAQRQARIEEIERQKAEVAAMEEDAEKPEIDETVPDEEPEMEEDVKRSRLESETTELQSQWRKEVISKHLIFIKGLEIVYFEFREIILALTVKLRETIDPKTGKMKVVLTKFIEDWLLRRLQSFLKFQIPATKTKTDAARQWPESHKDTEILALRREKERVAEDQRKKEEELKRVERELELMAAEDHNAMDQKEIEAIQRKMIEAEEAARRAREALEEGEEDDDEDSSDEDDDDEDEEEDDNASEKNLA